MVIVALVVGVAVVLVYRLARSRKSQLAGLNSAKPVFSVEPPRRNVGPPGRF